MTAPVDVRIHRVYGTPLPAGARVLVDRVWPRGVPREALGLHAWLPDVAPSTELRRWFGHREERWPEFKRRYRAELRDPAHAARLEEIRQLALGGPVLLLYSARDEAHNQAVVLRDVLTGSGSALRAPRPQD